MIRLIAGGAAFLAVLSARASSQGTDPGAPGPRRGHALVYDVLSRHVLMVDASPRTDSVRVQQVWRLTETGWSLVPAATAMPARTTAAIGYDATRGRVVMHGGRRGGMTGTDVVAGTWEWDGKSWLAADSSIGARDHHSIAFDSSRDRMVAFGGTVFPRVEGPWSAETWDRNGSTWKRVATTGPAGRITAMTYDARRNEVVLFGGHGPGQPPVYFGDTWLWNGTSWRQAESTGPPPRSGHAIAFDPRTGEVLLYGGGTRIDGRFAELGDMWRWNGERWVNIPLSGENPGARTGHAMVFDESRGRLVLYGGSRGPVALADTWDWDGERWSKLPF